MKRIKALIPLSNDHHHGLILAQLSKKNAPEFKNLPNTDEEKIDYIKRAWDKELSVHFDNEEKILFPLVIGCEKKLDDLIKFILNDHRRIKKLINDLEKSTDYKEALNEFGLALENHIRIEERELFALIQEVLTEKEIEYLENNLSRAG